MTSKFTGSQLVIELDLLLEKGTESTWDKQAEYAAMWMNKQQDQQCFKQTTSSKAVFQVGCLGETACVVAGRAADLVVLEVIDDLHFYVSEGSPVQSKNIVVVNDEVGYETGMAWLY